MQLRQKHLHGVRALFCCIFILSAISLSAQSTDPTLSDTSSAVKNQGVSELIDIVCHQIIYRKYPIWPFRISKVSSGAFIAPGVILTAAHNVHSNPFTYIVNSQIVRKRNGEIVEVRDDFQSKCEMWKSTGIPKDFRFNHFDLDFAVLQLPTSDPDLNYVPLYPLDSADLDPHKPDSVYVIGYPAGDVFEKSRRMILSVGEIVEIRDQTITYKVYTELGSSGSPVFFKKDGNWVIVGVHVSEYQNENGEVIRKASKMTEQKIRTINSWIRKLKEVHY